MPPQTEHLRDFLLYLRKSVGRAGIARQRNACQRYADQHGIRIVAEFIDADRTAYSKVGGPRAIRDDYDRMLAMLRADDREVPLGVLSWHADRLDRNVASGEEFINVAAGGRHVVETARSGTYELWTPTGRKRFRNDVTDAAYEVDHMIERMEAMKAEMAEEGRWFGGRRPFGYDADGTTPRKAEAEAADAGSRAILAGLSLGHVAREWDAGGLRTTAGGKRFSPEDVRRILLRPRNAGIMVHRGVEVGPAAWHPIFCREMAGGDEDAWRVAAAERLRAVESVLSAPSRRTSPGSENRWLGAGLYLCGVCEGPLRSATGLTGGQTRPVYRCRWRQATARAEKHVRRDARALDDYVEAAIVERLSRDDAERVFMPERRHGGSTVALQAKAAGLRARIAEAGDMWEAGEITRAELSQRRARMRAELEDVQERIKALSQDHPLEGLIGVDDVAAVWGSWPLERRRAALARALRVTVQPAPPGRPPGWRPGTPYFSEEYVDLEWIPARG